MIITCKLVKDYKLVRVGRRTPSSVEIYTVGTASWKTVTAQGAFPYTWPQTASQTSRSIYFKGCLYILSSSELISFDLSKEVFKSVERPEISEYDNSVSWYFFDSLAFVDRGSSLAMLHFSPHGGSVWVLDENDVAASPWSMRCTFSMSVPRFLYLKKNGDLLFDSMDAIARPHVVSYSLHTEEERLTKYPKITSCILDYKESLVLLK